VREHAESVGGFSFQSRQRSAGGAPALQRFVTPKQIT
jgi:hypothetical protein